MVSSNLVFSSFSSIASNNFAVSPKDSLVESLPATVNKSNCRYFHMQSLVLSEISSFHKILKSIPGKNSKLCSSLVNISVFSYKISKNR